MALVQDRIGDWTQAQLTKFLQRVLRDDSTLAGVVRSFDELTINRLAKVIDEIQFSNVQSTVGAAGSASALPATPAGYIRILDHLGSVKVIPYYNP